MERYENKYFRDCIFILLLRSLPAAPLINEVSTGADRWVEITVPAGTELCDIFDTGNSSY